MNDRFWDFSDWCDSEPIDPRLVDIEKEHADILTLKRKVEAKAKNVKDMVINLEKEMYNGLTYVEYIKSLHGKTFIKDDINIEIMHENIFGECKIEDKNKIFTLSYTVSIKKGSSGIMRLYTTRKTIDTIPNKYNEKINELKEECHKHQIEDITGVWRRLYGVDEKESSIWDW